MYNVVLLWKGEAHFIDSVELGANCGELIFQCVAAAKKTLEAKGIMILGVVGDNASGVQNALARCVMCSFKGLLGASL